MSQHVWWYTARAGGAVAYTLVTASVVWGLALATRLARHPRPAWVLDLHRFLGALAIVFTGVHLAGLAADSYVHFGPADLLVPFATHWKPDAVAWGIVAFYVLCAVEVTSLAMRWLPRRLWHSLHLGSFLIFTLATVHLFAAGTDSSRPAVQWAVLSAVVVVLFLTLVRILSGRGDRAPARAGTRPGEQAVPACKSPVTLDRAAPQAPDRPATLEPARERPAATSRIEWPRRDGDEAPVKGISWP